MNAATTIRLAAWRELRTQALVYLALPVALGIAQLLELNRRSSLELFLALTAVPAAALWLGLGRDRQADAFWRGLGGSPALMAGTRAAIQLPFVLAVGALVHQLLVADGGIQVLPAPLAKGSGLAAWLTVLAVLWASAALGRQFLTGLALVVPVAGVLGGLVLTAQVGIEVGHWALLDGVAVRGVLAVAVALGGTLLAARAWTPWAVGLRPLGALQATLPLAAVLFAGAFGLERIAPNLATGDLGYAGGSRGGTWAAWAGAEFPWGPRKALLLGPEGTERGQGGSVTHGAELWDDGRRVTHSAEGALMVRFADGHWTRCPDDLPAPVSRMRWNAAGDRVLLSSGWRQRPGVAVDRSSCAVLPSGIHVPGPGGDWRLTERHDGTVCPPKPGGLRGPSANPLWTLHGPDGTAEELGRGHAALWGDERLVVLEFRPDVACGRVGPVEARFFDGEQETALARVPRLSRAGDRVCGFTPPHAPVCWRADEPIPVQPLAALGILPPPDRRQLFPLWSSSTAYVDRAAQQLIDAETGRRWDVSDFVTAAAYDPDGWKRLRGRVWHLKLTADGDLLFFDRNGRVETLPPLPEA